MAPRPDSDAAVAVTQIAVALLRELGRARRHVLRGGEDPEALHDYRVALRRLRSVTRALRPIIRPAEAPRLERSLRRIARGTGPARDLEVLAAWVRQAADAMPPGLGALLREELERDRVRAAEQLERVLRTRVHAAVVDLFDAVFRDAEALLEGGAQPLADVARAAAEPLVAAAITDAEALAEEPAMAGLHQLRISLKRVRYALEAFAGAWPAGVLRLRATLKRMQDQLGAVHDADVHAQWVVRTLVRTERRRLKTRGQGVDALEIAELQSVLGALAPNAALLEDAERVLHLLETERERAVRSAMRLLQRRGLPGLEALRTALARPRPAAARRVAPPTPPVAVEP